MSSKTVENLVEKLSCDFVLADPSEPESLSSLLPILKQIHTYFIKANLKDNAKEIITAKKLIDEILSSNPESAEKSMNSLGEWISGFSSSMTEFSSQEETIEKTTDSETYQIEALLHKFTRLIGHFCPGEIPDLGAMLNVLEELRDASEQNEFALFRNVVLGCRKYVENMTLENIHNTVPIEQGVTLLKSVLEHLKKGKTFDFDYSDVMQMLDPGVTEDAPPIAPYPKEKQPKKIETPVESQEEGRKIAEDDMPILIDFVAEAQENLENIEINLIDLEQDPSNMDIINNIFRPFHTIKGVSGFLSLNKINTLAHTTENLLDSARSGDFLIDDAATDAILESVDTLKILLARTKEGTQRGFLLPEDDIDVDTLRGKLKTLQFAMQRGEKPPLGEILLEKGDITKETLDTALEIQKERPDKKIGEILIQENKAGPKQVAAALMDQKQVKKTTDTQVKVSTQKLDDLVDYAGELVIAQSMLRQQTASDPSLSQSVTQLGQIVTNMQSIAMSMRMIPIKSTFMKMIRLVRDLSRKSGKEVQLNMIGEETEIDRNVVDALYEPMVHMIRNSVDHGIESKQDRLETGKSPEGQITICAYHKGGSIVIEIEDDGKGLDKDNILKKATDTGLVSENEQLTDAQIYDLIMQPGFSTAKTITDVSGRGVGMDVVKDGIEKFRGHLNIESQKGAGTKFTISLPLTLAIIDGMLVEVEKERYVIPTTAIQKAFKPEKKDCFTIEGKGEMVKDRGDLIPVIRLNEIYNNGSRDKFIWDNLVVVVESNDVKKALLIDELLGKDEYVIKNLGGSLEDVEGLAGGAILADGRVGLILDIHGIFEIAAS